jgi:predicted Zn-dependent protease
MNPPPRTAAQVSSPAVMSLLNVADTQAKAGHREQAAAALDRALDLAPRNPFIYQRLAAVRLTQGQAGQAEQLARKSNSVAGDNPFVKASNWRLIAEARHNDGDAKGARAASARAMRYRSASRPYQRQ